MRKRRKILVVMLLLTGGALPAVSDLAVGETAAKHLGQVLAAGQDAMAMLTGRSPGRRVGGLVSSKPAYAPSQRPTERVLSGVRHRPPTPLADANEMIDNVFGNPVQAPAAEGIAFNPPASGPDETGVLGPDVLGPAGESSTPLIMALPSAVMDSSGSSSGGGGTNTPPTTPVAPTGVPEPSTWITMLAGFGLIGAGMRCRRRAAAQTAGSAAAR